MATSDTHSRKVPAKQSFDELRQMSFDITEEVVIGTIDLVDGDGSVGPFEEAFRVIGKRMEQEPLSGKTKSFRFNYGGELVKLDVNVS